MEMGRQAEHAVHLGGEHLSAPPGGPAVEGQQWPIPQGVPAVAAGDVPRRGPGVGGEGGV